VIDGIRDTVVATIPFSAPTAVAAVDPGASRVYAIQSGPLLGSLAVIDGTSDDLLGAIKLLDPVGLAADPRTHRVYISVAGDEPSGEIVEVDGVTGSVVSSVHGAGLLASDPRTDQLYIYSGHVRMLARRDLAGRGAGAAVTTTGDLGTMAINPALNRLYAARRHERAVAVYDGTSLASLATIALPSDPVSLAVNPSTDRLYVVGADGTLAIVDGDADAVTATLSIGVPAGPVAVDPTRNLVFVANRASGAISVIDDFAPTLTATTAPGDKMR
jgi:DNA-binding beta-propeller fold protein YncE